jgi:short-subunit dehydrogenase
MAETSSGERKAYIITGPTSGIGQRTAVELAKYGTVVLVGRDQGKLDEVQQTIERAGQQPPRPVHADRGAHAASPRRVALGW